MRAESNRNSDVGTELMKSTARSIAGATAASASVESDMGREVVGVLPNVSSAKATGRTSEAKRHRTIQTR